MVMYGGAGTCWEPLPPLKQTGAPAVPPADPVPPVGVPISHTASSTVLVDMPVWKLRKNSVNDRKSRPRTGSIDMKSLSRKLQAKPPPLKLMHCELAATMTG